MRALTVAGCILFAAHGISAQPQPPDLSGLQFLVGNWQAADASSAASGGFSFAPAAQGHAIVRTNYSITAATKDRPASRHDDVMTIYVDGAAIRADYVDSEGHAIHYAVTTTPQHAVFLSDAKSSEPRYRLSYSVNPDGTLAGTFEIAPPPTTDKFAMYLSWTARRR